MPKFSKRKVGHLIKGDVEYTVVRNHEIPFASALTSYQYKVDTFPTIYEAAECARRGWLSSCDAGRFNETYKVYKHTKGKITYSDGHYLPVSWQDYDSTSIKVPKDKLIMATKATFQLGETTFEEGASLVEPAPEPVVEEKPVERKPEPLPAPRKVFLSKEEIKADRLGQLSLF